MWIEKETSIAEIKTLLDNGYEVELIPYIEKGKYTFTQYNKDGVILLHLDEGDEREFEFDFEADWMELV